MRLAVTVVSIVVVAVAVTVLALFLWLRTYAPLTALGGQSAPGPELASDVQPTPGSGGREVFIPVAGGARRFDAAFTLRNTGRFAVIVTGLVRDADPALYADRLLLPDDSAAGFAPRDLHRFSQLRLEPNQSALVAAEWRLDCGAAPGARRSTWQLRLRYRYLSAFTRTATVELPFAVTLRC